MSFKLTDFITVTGTGNVGIGTTSPNRNLSIVSTTDTSVEIKSGTANQSSLWFSDTDDGNIGGVLYTHNDNGMEFRVNDSTRLTITSGGNVGIGTGSTAPQNNLTIQTATDVRVGIYGGVGYSGIQSISDNNNVWKSLRLDGSDIEFRIQDVPKLTISSGGAATFNGNVKVGTSTTITPTTGADDLVIDKNEQTSGISIISTIQGSVLFSDAADGFGLLIA